MVLPLDSGYYGLLVFHTAGGLSSKLNVQTIEALRDHHGVLSGTAFAADERLYREAADAGAD